MKRLYKIPCMGKALKKTPLTGDPNNPICSIPLAKMAREAGVRGIKGYEDLEYNLDEGWVLIRAEVDTEAHNWILGMLPSLKQVAIERHLVLDKSSLRD